MWPFDKKSKVLDFTKSPVRIPNSMTSSKDAVDMTSPNSEGLGFLGAIASGSDIPVSEVANEDINTKHLKVKIEDMEYKVDNLLRKINGVMDRIDLIEKKVDRNDRRG
mgnify:CR=1 FL=1